MNELSTVSIYFSNFSLFISILSDYWLAGTVLSWKEKLMWYFLEKWPWGAEKIEALESPSSSSIDVTDPRKII